MSNYDYYNYNDYNKFLSYITKNENLPMTKEIIIHIVFFMSHYKIKTYINHTNPFNSMDYHKYDNYIEYILICIIINTLCYNYIPDKVDTIVKNITNLTKDQYIQKEQSIYNDIIGLIKSASILDLIKDFILYIVNINNDNSINYTEGNNETNETNESININIDINNIIHSITLLTFPDNSNDYNSILIIKIKHILKHSLLCFIYRPNQSSYLKSFKLSTDPYVPNGYKNIIDKEKEFFQQLVDCYISITDHTSITKQINQTTHTLKPRRQSTSTTNNKAKIKSPSSSSASPYGRSSASPSPTPQPQRFLREVAMDTEFKKINNPSRNIDIRYIQEEKNPEIEYINKDIYS